MKKQQYITPATEVMLLMGSQQLMALSIADGDLMVDDAESREIFDLLPGIE